ncbi:metallophosphoesterase [Bdellovibrio sp. HCB337]|uniref:metallophosphoesterase n=1 Tax=Bdellovibrio sp. HCB337 TaxID=3394358 RepID=UPI0039A45C9D
MKETNMPSFKSAKYTAIISDLHLCEAEPVNPKYPLWKKFKTRQFFFDDIFTTFLKEIEAKAKGEAVELVLNGDIFDFDSVLKIPDEPIFNVSRLEKKRGLYPRSERSCFKIKVILEDHAIFVKALREFVLRGNRVVFVIGNHDLELHFPDVQKEIRHTLGLNEAQQGQVRFVEWFYISNEDTLIEHGNQYDPYCLCEDPINPYVQGYNHISLKLPFGNMACRFIMNGLGFFNPHVDSNYIMGLREYITIFMRYMVRAQPFLVFTWFFGSVETLIQSFKDRLAAPIRNPLKIEERIEQIALKANAEPRMVRELKELFVAPAASNPFLLARELWLDRAFLIGVAFFLIFQLMLFIRQVYDLSFFWAFIPMFLLLPFFLFYSKSITSMVSSYKEPNERIMAMTSAITRVKRIIYGHTHSVRHEMIGAVEHLNSGCWSPAFLDIECTKPLDQKTYIWISPQETGERQAELYKFIDGQSQLFMSSGSR